MPTASTPHSTVTVLLEVLEVGPMTRPELARRLDLSKPTVSAAVRELEALGLLAHVDTSRGRVGRMAAVYAPGPHAGYIVALDIGVTQVRIAASDLGGRVFHQRTRARSSSNPDSTRSMVTAVGRHVSQVLQDVGTDRGQPRGVVVAVPHLVEHVAGEGADRATLATALSDACVRAGLDPGVPLSIENNVNCSALAEASVGVARDTQTFAILQVGVRVGAAFMNNGHLIVGASGAAGEPAYLPFPWTTPRTARGGDSTPLETHLGAVDFMRRVAEGWPRSAGHPPHDVAELVERAVDRRSRGHATAVAMVAEHAADIGEVAVAISALLDPGVIVLSGGVGSNPVFSQGVRTALSRLPWPTEVRVSALGGESTVIGATQLAKELGVRQVVAELTGRP